MAKKAGASRKSEKKAKKAKPAKAAKPSKPAKDAKRAASTKAKGPSKPAKEKQDKPVKKVEAGKVATEKAPKPAPEKAAKGAKPAEAPAAAAAPADAKKDAGRKGITIVTPKPMKRPKSAPAVAMPTGLGQLLGPNGIVRKPLIPSGPKSTTHRALGQHGGPDEVTEKPVFKTHLGKKELEHFRSLLLRKRAELVGDVSTMETGALLGESGSLSNVPSHLAEQGSDASEQSLSLDLAAADRKLIREIDDALARINNGTYGVCELTGKPIKQERLEELPWARHTIEAARELERLAMRG
ncbi:MAG: hypothetical protein GC200_04620 [Tepidisphaera sp.]|nr:hypothetical protein [Tepidisphaera sp.]